jgi:hypothetical protein
MSRKVVVSIVSCTLLSCLLIFVLYATSHKVNSRKNNFVRLMPPGVVNFVRAVDVKYNSYYIAGATNNHIYLGNRVDPRHMLIINSLTADTQHIHFRFSSNPKLIIPKVAVDSPYFYITDGGKPAVFNGNLNDFIPHEHKYDSAYFTEAVVIDSGTFIIRTLSNKIHEYLLAKETNNFPHIQLKCDLLQRQIDGIFCTDGMLLYDKRVAKLVYLYFYRNEFMCVDTNLNLLYRSRTIDTVRYAHIKIARLSDSSLTMAEPPLVVNKKSCVSGNRVFVNSSLVADNEDKTSFNQSSVIDVYDLRNGGYKLSFYVPDPGKEKMRSFMVFNNTLLVLKGHHLLTYSINPRYFAE